MYYGFITFGDLVKIWRLLLAVVICNLLGGLIGRLVGPHHSAFMNWWMGGALAGPVGFVIGWRWQRADDERWRTTPKGLVAFLGLLAAAVAAMCVVFAIPDAHETMRRLDRLTHLDASTVRRIEVYDRYGSKLIRAVDEPALIREFTDACRDAEGHMPNHPRYTQYWYVVVEGDRRQEYMCHFERNRPTQLDGDFVHQQGNTTTYYGSFTSVRLRSWFETHVLKWKPASPGVEGESTRE